MSWHLVTKHDDEIEANVAAESHDHFVLPPVAIVDVHYTGKKEITPGAYALFAVKQAVNEMTKSGKKECGKEERKHQWRVRTYESG